jgi:hypothetical protein
MHKYLILLLVFSTAFSQGKKVSTADNKIYSQFQVDKIARYSEGSNVLYSKIYRNYKNPKKLKKEGITICFVAITLVVEKDGTISNLKIIKDCGYGTGEEAIRVLKTLKKWNPGTIKNKAVRSILSIPIHLRNLE